MSDLHPRRLVALPTEEPPLPYFTIMQFNVLADGLSGLRHDLGGFLALHGYTGHFAPKPASPCLQVSDRRDGCAIFIASRFTALTHDVLSYECCVPPSSGTPERQNQLALVLELRDEISGRPLTVACTHLKAAKDAAGEDIRQQEASMLCSHLASKQAAGHPIVICGDFNAVPSSPTYATMVKAHAYTSAYCLPNEPEYTTWKVRPGKESKHTIDYIFFTGETLRTVAVADIPIEIEECRLPSYKYPSDHVALVAEFCWK
ncbi:nocturnin-like isoform 2 [Achlya hypogyna]|uniref:Nocturnin-like isoform 2 n=1 Tax=Achlya hypogyna TaxID=1202772 RepID=A0A1V9ZPI2_ACHHY|nr:nocturnin-like isoform 2 [Achlya hypogyna]